MCFRKITFLLELAQNVCLQSVLDIRHKKNAAHRVTIQINQEFQNPIQGFRTSKPGGRSPGVQEEIDSGTRLSPVYSAGLRGHEREQSHRPRAAAESYQTVCRQVL